MCCMYDGMRVGMRGGISESDHSINDQVDCLKKCKDSGA